jgi:hypothetical protein
LNIKGYYDPFLKLVRNAVDEGFAGERTPDLILTRETPQELLSAFLNRKPRDKMP